MLHLFLDNRPWFRPKSRGYGTGLPIAWQGWVLMAAHIALMHDEVVRRRRWLTDEGFLDLLGATNLIPGPNSTEMAIHIGYVRAGWRGLLLGGICFIAPAMLIVLALGPPVLAGVWFARGEIQRRRAEYHDLVTCGPNNLKPANRLNPLPDENRSPRPIP